MALCNQCHPLGEIQKPQPLNGTFIAQTSPKKRPILPDLHAMNQEPTYVPYWLQKKKNGRDRG